ncbi:hypothetical protein ACFXAW_06860 [Streptomyces sp. NPDC059445]|uniref:hypothetical protein n=1 Tax=Streptomyces sp. NPDC059445 TaxID=3346832 RepID=UPI0036CED4ED
MSSILTSGSLFLGFYIILRDHKKAEEVDARKFVVVAALDGDTVKITAHNRAERPFYALMALTPRPDFKGRDDLQFPGGVLMPGESLTMDIKLHGEPMSATLATAVSFADADGRSWMRLPMTNELLRIVRSQPPKKYVFALMGHGRREIKRDRLTSGRRAWWRPRS